MACSYRANLLIYSFIIINMLQIKKILLCHTETALSQYVPHVRIYNSLNIQGMEVLATDINRLILPVHAPNRNKRAIYGTHNIRKMSNGIKSSFIFKRVWASVGKSMCRNAFSARHTLGKNTQTEDLDIPWISPTSEKKSAFAIKRKVHNTWNNRITLLL